MLPSQNLVGAPSPSPSRAKWPPPTVLITEQEVMLLNAAITAGSSRPSPLTRWVAAARAMFAARPASERRARPHDVAKHYAYLESAAMAREMEHL